MILSGKEIKNHLGKDLLIEPFDEKQLNPNSYNLRLHSELMVYKEAVLDMKKQHEIETFTIPEEGYVMRPGELYLARTFEYTRTDRFVPMLEGRSSIGRLGLFTTLLGPYVTGITTARPEHVCARHPRPPSGHEVAMIAKCEHATGELQVRDVGRRENLGRTEIAIGRFFIA